MITLITGAPGAGKSAALLEMLVDWQQKQRRIYVDVQQDGPAAGQPSIPGLCIEHELLQDARRWHEPGQVVDGAVVVLDEVQRVWRPTPAGSRVSDDIQALETHRHRGLDFLLVTQHPSLLNQNVRRLVGRHVHLRDVGVLGRYWYEWPEATNPETFRNAPVKKRYRLPRRVFGLYKSASLHVKPVRSVPRSLIVAALAVVILGWLAWRAYSSVSAKLPGGAATPAPSAASAPRLPQSGPVVPALLTQQRHGVGAVAVSAPVTDREPYAGLGLHLAGTVAGHTPYPVAWFTASLAGRVVATVTQDQLRDAGYSWRQFGPCIGLLIYGERERVVTCDTPSGVQPQSPAKLASAPV